MTFVRATILAFIVMCTVAGCIDHGEEGCRALCAPSSASYDYRLTFCTCVDGRRYQCGKNGWGSSCQWRRLP